MRRPGTVVDAAASKSCPRTSKRGQRRRRQIVPTTPPSALLSFAGLLLITASHGIALRSQALARSRSVVAVSRPPHALWPARRKRCRERELGLLPRRCVGTNGGTIGDLRGKNGPSSNGAAGAVVHTLLIDNYDSYTYNLFQLLAVVNGRAPFVVYNDDDGGDLW